MSTRANIVIKDGYNKLFFYRHSDGYPEGTMPTLNIFMDWLQKKIIRNNTQQCAGWLVVLGAIEYGNIPDYKCEKKELSKGYTLKETDLNSIQNPDDWKVGAYEPTTGIHGDIEYLYVIDLNEKTVKCYEDWTDDGEGKGKEVDTTVQNESD